jgi:acetyltransferase-like isoleucine patch superfamily enzyme
VNDDDSVAHLTGGWNYSSLPPNVHVGSDCFLQSEMLFRMYQSVRDPGLVLGDRVRVHLGGWGGSFAVLRDGCVHVGDDSILVGAQIICMDRVTIGKRVVLSYNCIVADSDFHSRDPADRRRELIAGAHGHPQDPQAKQSVPVTIGDDAKVGMNAMILKGVTIGPGAIVGAGAVVTRDVPPGATVVGNPAQVVR